MFKSPYATQFTREQMDGKKNPSRNMENRVATQAAKRRREAIAKAAKAKA